MVKKWTVVAGVMALSACAVAPETAEKAEPAGEKKETMVAQIATEPQLRLDATSSVSKPVRTIPSPYEQRHIRIQSRGPIHLETFLQRVADQAGIVIEIQERPARDGQSVDLQDPNLLTGEWAGKLRDVLNQLTETSGYAWEFKNENSAEIVFYRYHDAAWKKLYKPEDQSEPVWTVNPTRDNTLKAVVEGWARSVGWNVVWKEDTPNYAVSTPAKFKGSFEEAVGQLLYATLETRQPIAPVAYPANQQIVIEKQQ